MTFVKRKINVTVRLGKGGTFGDSSYDTVTLTGYRVQCHVQQVVGPATGQAQIRIHGLGPSLMNQLSALNKATMAIRDNSVTVEAGDDIDGMAVIFRGQIIVGQQCLNTAPETSLLIIAQGGTAAMLKRIPPSSYPGTADAALILNNICALLGWKFENSGVSVLLSTPYFPGDAREQIRACAQAGRFEYTIDDGDGSPDSATTLAIWPAGSVRNGLIPVVSPDTGMNGYPNYSTATFGLDIETRFNPLLYVGGKVEVRSSLKVANAVWQVFGIEHDLEAEVPGGKWFTRFNAASLAQDVTQ